MDEINRNKVIRCVPMKALVKDVGSLLKLFIRFSSNMKTLRAITLTQLNHEGKSKTDFYD